jgi:predicted nucleic acid-binding protein
MTAYITIAEIARKGDGAEPSAEELLVDHLFESECIHPLNVERLVCERARDLVRQYSDLSPYDALHVAAARRANCLHLHTYDPVLLALDGAIEGMRITNPAWNTGQTKLNI